MSSFAALAAGRYRPAPDRGVSMAELEAVRRPASTEATQRQWVSR
jgi:hypothetical protein